MPALARERVENREQRSSLFVIDDRAPVGRVIKDNLLFASCSEEGKWENQVLYL